ncbi:MAG: 3'-5' exonuclease [Methanomicrobiaceae archaeon]|nr:3'-5' exonuclease [Methanomicrobiaceae archaeon]
MKYLFFDCETTGIFENSEIPRLVQMGWVIYDTYLGECRKKEYIIIPDGFEIPEESVAIHNITTQAAKDAGYPFEHVFLEFSKDLQISDLVISHNFEYDSRIIENEVSNIGLFFSFLRKKSFCTMKSTAHLCKIPGPYGDKWPKLQELYYFLFGKYPKYSHNALEDASTCAKCFLELKKRELIKLY